MDAYIRGESNGDEIVDGFVWNAVLTVTAMGLAQCIDLGLEIGRTHAEQYLNGVVGSRLTEKLLSEGMPSSQVAKAVKQMRNLGYTDDFIRELADNISAEQLIRMNRMNRKGLGKGFLDILFRHSRQLENYSDDLIWRLDRIGSYTDDILKLVDDYGEAFTRQMDADDLSRLGRLVNEGLADDVVDAVIKHADHFADYSDDAIKKIAESGCNAERILTQIDNYAKDFTEDLTAGQLKRLDDILEQGVTPEQFEVLVKHGKQIENYTDEIVGLWRNYSGNGDDFLRLVDEFGDEFVEAFQKNGDEAVKQFNRRLESNWGIYKEINIHGIINSEIDEVDIMNGIIYEDKSAKNLYMENPAVPQTEEQWAFNQIYVKGANRIDAINQSDYTLSIVGSDDLPDIDKLKSIRNFVFRIDADTPTLRKAVEECLHMLSEKYPEYNFSAKFGGE